jgi:hypothetical protein
MTDGPTKTATADDAAAKALEARRESERQAAEAAGRRDADKVVGAVKSAVDTAKAGAAFVGDTAKKANEVGIDGMAADARRRGEEANKSLNIGSLLGGLGGLILAYIGAPMVASFLGLGDIFGTLGMIMMAIPMMIMGSSQFGDTINGWLGRPKAGESTKVQAQGAAPAKAQAQAAVAPVTTIPHEALVAMLADAKEKGLNANHVMFRKDTQGHVIPSLIDIEKAPQAVKNLKEKGGVIPVTTFKDAMDICQAKGFDHAIAFTPAEGDAVRPQGCVPKATASAAR